jgi:uncharacterized membrane protein YccC
MAWIDEGLWKAAGGMVFGLLSAFGGARAWRQRDRKAQARSVSDSEELAAEGRGRISAIEGFKDMALAAEARALAAERREREAVERADRAADLMRQALQQANDHMIARERAESRAEHMEDRIAELEAKIVKLERGTQ